MTTVHDHTAGRGSDHSSHRWVRDFAEGSRDQADLLGGKGAGLAEMTRLGLPVPPGFTITTEACRHYLHTGQEPDGLMDEVTAHLGGLEKVLGRRFGDAADPLLVAVRSGARRSMPGMMDTVLDVGLNDRTVAGLAARAGDRFAWDCYRRLVQMYGRTVLGVDGAVFEEVLGRARSESGVATDHELTADQLRSVVATCRRLMLEHSGEDLPQDPSEQLHRTVVAVFRSWNSPRARTYRAKEGIGEDLGTAVNVVAMVFGNTGPLSGSGVCFTRDPATGAPGAWGEFLPDAQGEDVVSGVRDPLPLDEMATTMPQAHAELLAHLGVLERHYRDVCDTEFTVEEGRLWMLQTRIGKRTAGAAFRFAVDLADEGLIDMDEALRRVDGELLEHLLHPEFDTDTGAVELARGLAASPGAAVGEIALDSARAVSRAAQGHSVVLVRPETSPDDLPGMLAAVAIVTARGGMTSHAAVVARGMGRTCVAGASDLTVDLDGRTVTGRDGRVLREGDVLSVDGTTGTVRIGALAVRPSPVADALAQGESGAGSTHPVAQAVLRLLTHADDRAVLEVRANADTGDDVALARRLGATGVGLARTEHMLLGDRRRLVEAIVMDRERGQALSELERVQRADLTALLAEGDGRPVAIRLLDPPLHEFLPDLTTLSVEVALAGSAAPADDLARLAAAQRWHEHNPMLGLRGVRLAAVVPEVTRAQVRALAEAFLDLTASGHDPRPELLVPLVADVDELRLVRRIIDEVLADVAASRGVPVPEIPVGAMVELPRAALTAGRLAGACDFFSFGTNDLTQTTWGLSRDDAESGFLPAYRRAGLLARDPFVHLDQDGVGRLVELAITEGRLARADLGLGVCGEHGGDPASVRYLAGLGLDYVSCSPWRVPVARLEAGRAAIS